MEHGFIAEKISCIVVIPKIYTWILLFFHPLAFSCDAQICKAKPYKICFFLNKSCHPLASRQKLPKFALCYRLLYFNTVTFNILILWETGLGNINESWAQKHFFKETVSHYCVKWKQNINQKQCPLASAITCVPRWRWFDKFSNNVDFYL